MEFERVHTLSSSPGAVLLVILVPDEARAILVKIFVFDETSVGRSAPLHPSGDGCVRVHTLSRSPGAILLEFWFPTMHGTVLVKIFVSDETSVGRSAPLHSLG